MFNLYGRNVMGWLAVGTLLVGCQSSSVVSPQSDSRILEHARGSIQVPLTPQQVVVLDTAALDAALALEIKPAGTVISGQPPDYLTDQVDGIEPVGETNQPNLEIVSRIKPDLMLGSKISHETLYPQLSQIAPTVLTEGSGREDDWQENLQLYAEALGRSEQAEQLLQEYQQQVKHLKATIDQPQALEISVLIISNDVVRTYTAGSFSGSILQDIGLARTPAQADDQGYALQLSPEALDAIDGDYIFLIYSTSRPGRLSKADFITHPLWSQLEAVKQDNVCQVSSHAWISGRNILAANQVLADIEACLQ